jgi:hypothetical protein
MSTMKQRSFAHVVNELLLNVIVQILAETILNQCYLLFSRTLIPNWISVIIPQASHHSSSCDPNFIGLVNIWYHDEYIRITTITITVNCYDSDVYTVISNIGLIQNNFHEHILEHVWDFKERFVQYLLELCRKLMSIFIHTIWHNTIQIVEKKVWTIQIYLLPHISIFQTQINKFNMKQLI